MSFWTEPPTLRSWLTTTDHKRIGILFLAGTTVALLLGGVLALLIRIEHLTPGPTIVSAATYNRLFTLHGVIMVWLFMIPSIPSGFGNIVLPLMIGAREVALPRLNRLSLYTYAVGAVVTLGAALAGGADTGWTFYTPYSATTPSHVAPIALGIFILGCSSIMTGINFIVTVHTMRAPGIGWRQLPLFVWGIYATAIIMLLATPVLGMTLSLVLLDHVVTLGLFDPAQGGDPVLYQHLFWFYSHPAVYIMILPAMGVISDVVCTMAHRQPSSYRAIMISSLGIAFVGFLTWGHHLFVAGQSVFDSGAFGILSMLVAIFSAIKVFSWVGTLYKGRIYLTTPLAYVFIFLFLFVFGGMAGVAQAAMSLDVHWHDTYFVVAHFHFIMVGGTLTGMLAAGYYWLPVISGRIASDRTGFVIAALIFGGFFITFFPQFLLGNGGMPRRYYDYPARFQVLHVVSTIGSLLLGGGLVAAITHLTCAAIGGRRAGQNPWASLSYEFHCPAPPPPMNFPAPVRATAGPYAYDQVALSTPSSRPVDAA